MSKTLPTNFVTRYGKELQKFFYEASLRGYGNEELLAQGSSLRDRDSEVKVIEGEDGSTKIIYECDVWRYSDKYFGGEPFGGMTVIRFCGIVCFVMNYWGKVLPNVNKQLVYDCLMPALMVTRPEHPWRGPNHYVAKNGLLYTNIWHGNIEKFYGQEKLVTRTTTGFMRLTIVVASLICANWRGIKTHHSSTND